MEASDLSMFSSRVTFFFFFFLHIKILIYISHVKMCKTVSNLQLKKQIPCDFVCHGLFLYMEILIHTW